MKPESSQFIERAKLVLGRAEVMLKAGLNEDAARAAYMASFHVAQAYIFERSARAAKSHKGLQIEFLRLTRNDARADGELRKFLSRAYEFKSVADYFAGPEPATSAQDAADAITTAKRFVAHFAALVPAIRS